MDSTLRTTITYLVADSYESTKLKINEGLHDHHSGKVEEDGSFSYEANFLFTPRVLGQRAPIVSGKGYLKMDGENTLIYFTISPNLIFVFLILLIFPIICIIAIFDNNYLMPGGKNNIWHIIKIFFLAEVVIFAVLLIGTYYLKLNFERRFDLTPMRK